MKGSVLAIGGVLIFAASFRSLFGPALRSSLSGFEIENIIISPVASEGYETGDIEALMNCIDHDEIWICRSLNCDQT